MAIPTDIDALEAELTARGYSARRSDRHEGLVLGGDIDIVWDEDGDAKGWVANGHIVDTWSDLEHVVKVERARAEA